MKQKILLIFSLCFISTNIFANYTINTSLFISNEDFINQHNLKSNGTGGVFLITGNGSLRLLNVLFSSNSAYHGGAIYNDNLLTIDSNVKFNSNYANYTGAAGSGGAIYNNGKIIVTSEVIFDLNKAYSGGAITNKGTMIVESKIRFSSNSTVSTGGAIFNTGTIIISSDTVFNSNHSNTVGGAIENQGIMTIWQKAIFSSNSSAGHGGAIFNRKGVLNLIADTENIKFIDNKQLIGSEKEESNAIYDQRGTINLWASKNANIIFNDRITSENSLSILNINQSSNTLPTTGKIILNEDMSGYTGQINLYGGEIELQAKPNGSNINTNKFFSGDINLESGTLSVLNNAIDNISVSILTTTVNANLKIDVDLSNDKSDNFTITNTVAGELNLTAINILGVSGTIGQIILFNNQKSPVLNILTTANYGGQEYTFSNSNIAGVLNYELTGITKTFKEIINDTDPKIMSYSLTENEILTENLGSLGREQLTIFGNNKDIVGNNGDGIYIASDKILNIENVNNWSGFNNTYGAIKNEGTLNISGTNFNNNEGQDIINNGNLILSGTCYFETGIIGNGTSTIDGNIINNGIIRQNEIKIQNNTILKLTKNAVLITNNLISNNATIDMVNEIIQQHNFKTISVTDTLNLSIDVDLINKQMDTITTDNYDGTGKININEINILTDIKQEKVSITFTTSTALKENITSVNTANSKVFKYDVEYNKNLGNLIFSLTKDINFTVIESQVANSVGGFVTQTTIFNQAFASMENIKSRILQVKNEITDESPLYASTANTIFFQKTNRIESGLWLRPFYSQETVNLDNLSVDNTLTGTLAGLDLATGEDSLISLYLGYAGSEQKYENIKVSQTGYILGATGMLLKEQWYAGLTANINFNKAESQSSYGTDNFDMNMYSVGAKAGYNFDLSDKWILEPNLMLMYGNVNSAEYQTTQGANVEGQSIANIIFEPQIKAKLNLENGWQPYGLIGYVVNAGDKVTTKVEEVEFDGQKIGNYVEFGAGIDKSFKNSPWSLYIQLTGRSGDRTGFDGNFGIKYSFLTAKEKKKISKIKKIQAKRKAKEEFLREKKKAELKEQQEIEEENKRIQQEEQEEQRRLEIQRRIEANYEE